MASDRSAGTGGAPGAGGRGGDGGAGVRLGRLGIQYKTLNTALFGVEHIV